jgi:DNA-binding CsgD family transcriptional regulator/tetratricopeptide (TPR) repeat protein
VLIEREHVLGRLTVLLDDAAAGSGRLVFLTGEAGIGKTSVVAALTEVAQGRLAVRRGACDSVATAAALGPFTDAVPELADVLEGAGTDVQRPSLFRRLRGALSGAPTLLVLEDVHWADEATLDLLRFLGRRLADLPLLVVATSREDEVPPGHPLATLLGDLATAPGVHRVQLVPLSVAGVRRLVEAAGSPLDVGQLHRTTDGNPFFVTELIAVGALDLPATVRDAVLARTSRLSAAAQRVLDAAAVLGQQADLGLLAEVSGQPGVAVDECVRAGTLIGATGGWVFRHELARRAVEERLAPAAAAELHARAWSALRARGVREERRLAHHAAGSGNAAAVLAHAPVAAARAARLGAHLEAAEHLRLALRFAGDDDERRATLLTALSYECYLTDQLLEAHAARCAAMELAEETGDPMSLGAHQRWLSRLSWFLGRNADSEQFAARAVATLEPLGDGHELAMAYSNLALLQMLAGDRAGAVHWGGRAVELARRIGDREAEIHALNNVGTALATDDDSPEGRRRLALSLELALADDAHEHAARAWNNLGSVAVINHRHTDAERDLRAGLAYCDERDLDSWGLYMRAWLGRSLAEQGRYAEAQIEVDRVLRHPHLSPVSRIAAAPVAGLLAARQDRDDQGVLAAAVAIADATGETQRLVPLASARAEVAWLVGRVADVVAEVDRAWPAAVAQPHPWALGELCWWLAVAGEPRSSPMPVAAPFARMLDQDWSGAAEEWSRLSCPLWAALALAASPALGDGRRALEIIDGLGAPAVRRAVLRDRYARGLPVPRGPRSTSRANPALLTGRELEVLQLLADGLSNADVAQRLYLSEKTVGHHVSAVLRKLGEPTRSRAVAAALRRRVIAPR